MGWLFDPVIFSISALLLAVSLFAPWQIAMSGARKPGDVWWRVPLALALTMVAMGWAGLAWSFLRFPGWGYWVARIWS